MQCYNKVMPKKLENEYALNEPNCSKLSNDEVRRALAGDFEGFKFFFENCMLMQDRDTRQFIHPTMNRGQQMIAKTIFQYIAKETRATSHKECVICGSRQFGKSTVLTAIANYIEAYVPGMENLNLVTTMHQKDAAAKFFKQKLSPIITNVHPMIFPTIERDTSTSSTLLHYKDIKGIRRGGYYEILSAGSNSVRSGTVSVWLCDEPSEYRNPEAVEDAISGAISSYGWSFTAYIGTFSDRLTTYFLNKIQTALDNPEEMELVFIPWFLVYGREGDEVGVDMNSLNEYEKDVIVPEMIKYDVPSGEFAQKIGWYRRRSLRTSKMRYEFPTSIDDILNLTADKKVFTKESIDHQRSKQEAGTPYRFVTDTLTRKVEAQKTDAGPFKIFRVPVYGHKYKVVADPITASSDDTDIFAMQVFDDNTLEQVAVFACRGLSVEDYADYAVSMAKIYNNAQICPESNVADAFVIACRGLGYYNFYYANQAARKKREPGIRTTASSKEGMIDNLKLMLDNKRLTLHDEDTIDELGWFEKKVKTGADGVTRVRMMAHAKKHDDRVACLWIYVGTLDDHQMHGKNSGFAFL